MDIELFNTKQAAERIGVTYPTLTGVLYSGRVPTPKFRVGAVKLWTAAEIENARRLLADRDRWLGRQPRGSE